MIRINIRKTIQGSYRLRYVCYNTRQRENVMLDDDAAVKSKVTELLQKSMDGED